MTDASIRTRSMALSVLVHAALLLALIYYVMTIKIPPFPEGGGGGGVLVDVGYINPSTGEVQPMSTVTTEHPQPAKAQPVPTTTQPDVMTQDDEVTAAVEAIKKHDPKKATVIKPVTNPIVVKPKTVVERPREADPRAIYRGPTTTSQSQGTSTMGSGDQGDRQGTINGSYQGTSGTGRDGTGGGDSTGRGPSRGPGTGPGIGYNLSGRSLTQKPVILDRSQETGKVVVDITVDRNGNVVDASPYGRGSTNVSAYLRGLAKEGAMKAKFSPNPDGPVTQKGTMTFVFVVQ